MVHFISDRIAQVGLQGIQGIYPDWLVGIRQNGLVIGLELDRPEGAKYLAKHLFANSVWAIFSTLDPGVLQYKPGILLSPDLAEEILQRTEVAVGLSRAKVRRDRKRQS